MKTNNSAWLKPAVRIIAATDPKVYDAMIACDWRVNVVSNTDQLMPVARKLGPDYAVALLRGVAHGYAMTLGKTDEDPPEQVDDTPALLRHSTWFNAPLVEQEAPKLGVDLDKFKATVLVHEFVHRKGYGERRAYERGTEFARKLGEPALVTMSEETWRQVEFKQTMEKLGINPEEYAR